MMPVIACLLVGILLGQRFNVLVPAPAIALIIALSTVFGVARADALWSVAAMAMVATANLQMGYLAPRAINTIDPIQTCSRRDRWAREAGNYRISAG